MYCSRKIASYVLCSYFIIMGQWSLLVTHWPISISAVNNNFRCLQPFQRYCWFCRWRADFHTTLLFQLKFRGFPLGIFPFPSDDYHKNCRCLCQIKTEQKYWHSWVKIFFGINILLFTHSFHCLTLLFPIFLLVAQPGKQQSFVKLIS